MGGKPPLFRLLAWLGRDLGKEGLAGAIVKTRRMLGHLAADRPLAKNILERALGRTPTEDELTAAVEERAGVQAELLSVIALLDEASIPALLGGQEKLSLKPFKKALSAGKGLILASPHFGNYPLLLLGLAQAGLPIRVMFINSRQYEWLEPYGIKAVPFGSGALDCLRALSANETVFVFSDLDFFPEGRTAPFMGAPIRPPQGLARLAEAAGSPIIPVYSVRTGPVWRVEPAEAIPPGSAASVEKALLDSMERRIRQRPGHWVMFRDIWDIEATDRANRRRLALQRFFESVLPP